MKAGKIVLRLRACLPPELRAVRRRLHRTARSSPDRAVHDVRKSIKKARAFLRLAAAMAGRPTVDAVGHPLRRAAHALGPLRDHLVLRETARAVAGRGETPPVGTAAPDAAPRLKQARTQVRQAAAALSHLLREGFEAEGAAHGLRSIYRRAVKAMKDAAKSESDEDLHAWRRRAKDLFYVVELLRAPDGVVRKLKRLTQLLGDDHDLATFTAHHRSGVAGAIRTKPIERAARRRAPLQKKAFRLGKKLFADSPRDFVRRLVK